MLLSSFNPIQTITISMSLSFLLISLSCSRAEDQQSAVNNTRQVRVMEPQVVEKDYGKFTTQTTITTDTSVDGTVMATTTETSSTFTDLAGGVMDVCPMNDPAFEVSYEQVTPVVPVYETSYAPAGAPNGPRKECMPPPE